MERGILAEDFLRDRAVKIITKEGEMFTGIVKFHGREEIVVNINDEDVVFFKSGIRRIIILG